MVDGSKVVIGKILLDKHTVHGGRRAEGGDVELLEHGQNLLGVKAVKVIDEHRSLAQPLAVKLAPERLAPAGLGDGEMQPVALDQMPVFGCYVVPQRILVAVHGDLWIARGTGSKEHEHGIVAAGCIVAPAETAREERILFVKVVPALA